MGQFLETDEFYRNQFETKTSCGALDPENETRTELPSSSTEGAATWGCQGSNML